MADKLAVIQSTETINELKLIESSINDLIGTFETLEKKTSSISNGLLSGKPKEFASSYKVATDAIASYNRVSTEANSINAQIEKTNKKIADSLTYQNQLLVEEKVKLQQVTKENKEYAAEKIRLENLSEKEKQRLGNTLQIYTAVEKKMQKLQLEYRNLAVAKEMGMKLTDKEVQRMDYLKGRIEKYDTTLKAVDATMGKHTRHVGNYERANNGLGMSLAQITREMPAFANSAQTGFMALSNNIPIFFDAIGQVKKLNKELQAQGKPTTSVLKQIAGALFSWQTALSVGVTLLTVYGADIVKWAKNMIFGASAIKKANDMLDENIDLTKKMNDEYSDSLSLYIRLRQEWIASSGDLKKRNDFLKESKDEFSKLGVEINSVAEAEDFLIKNTANVVKALSLRARAAAFQDIAKEEQRKSIDEQKKVEKDLKILEDKNASFWSKIGPTFRTITNPSIYSKRGKYAGKIGEINSLNATNESIKLENEADSLLDKYKPSYKTTKEKPYKGSQLTGGQKDYLMELQSQRDTELTNQKKLLYDKKINEETYWSEYKAIIIRYRDDVDAYLQGKNAKEKKIDAETKKRALDEVIKANEELFNLDKESLTKRQKLEEEYSSNRITQIKQNDLLNEVGVINEQIKAYNDLYDTTDEYYKNLIKSAETNKQLQSEINAIQLERQTKLADVAGKRDALVSGLGEASIKDTNAQAEFLKTIQELSFEEQKRAILANKKLTADQRSYMLSILEKDNTIKENNLEIERLKTLKNQLQVKIALAQLSGVVNPSDLAKIAEYDKQISGKQNQNTEAENAKKQLEADKAFNDLQPLRNIINQGFQGLGLGDISDEFDTLFKSIVDKAKGASDNFKEIWKDATKLVGEYAQILVEQQTQRQIEALDQQLEASRNATEQELGFIDKRLEYYSNMEDLTAEQIADRNALEDEARAYREQQEEREKLIAIEKAKALQRAQAQQTLISGAQGAILAYISQLIPGDPTSPIRGAIAATATMSFSALMAALIMSKNPVPQYFVGRSGGRAEFALTQERGAEAIISKDGEIKTFGDNKGAQMTWLDEGDSVLTADKTKKLVAQIKDMPDMDSSIYRKIAKQGIMAPIIMNNNVDNSDAIAEKVGKEFDKVMNKYDKEYLFEKEGMIFSQKGGQIPVLVGRAKKNKIEIKVNRNGRD